MNALYLLIPLSLITLGIAAWLFLRMNGDGQFDEGDGPAWSVLMDDDSPDISKPHKSSDEKNKSDSTNFDNSQ